MFLPDSGTLFRSAVKSVFTGKPAFPGNTDPFRGKPTATALDFAAYFANPIRVAGTEPPENFTGKAAALPLKVSVP